MIYCRWCSCGDITHILVSCCLMVGDKLVLAFILMQKNSKVEGEIYHPQTKQAKLFVKEIFACYCTGLSRRRTFNPH